MKIKSQLWAVVLPEIEVRLRHGDCSLIDYTTDGFRVRCRLVDRRTKETVVVWAVYGDPVVGATRDIPPEEFAALVDAFRILAAWDREQQERSAPGER